MSVDVEIEVKLAELTEWGLSTVYRFEGDPPGLEMKLTLTRGQESFPTIKVGDPVMVILSWEEEEEEDEEPLMPGPDGTSLLPPQPGDDIFGAPGPQGRCPRCDSRGVYDRKWGPGPDDVAAEPCDCTMGRMDEIVDRRMTWGVLDLVLTRLGERP